MVNVSVDKIKDPSDSEEADTSRVRLGGLAVVASVSWRYPEDLSYPKATLMNQSKPPDLGHGGLFFLLMMSWVVTGERCLPHFPTTDTFSIS